MILKKMIYKEIDKKQKEVGPKNTHYENSRRQPDTTSYYSQFFTMKGIENIALKKLNHFRSYVTRST